MTDPIEYLDVDDLVALAVALLGEPSPIRDLGLLAAAADRRHQPSATPPTPTCGPRQPRG